MKKKLIPFTYEDRELFRGKWIRLNVAGKDFIFKQMGHIPVQEHQIVAVAKEGVSVIIGARMFLIPYNTALEQFEFINGDPFGKEQPSLIIAN